MKWKFYNYKELYSNYLVLFQQLFNLINVVLDGTLIYRLFRYHFINNFFKLKFDSHTLSLIIQKRMHASGIVEEVEDNE